MKTKFFVASSIMVMFLLFSFAAEAANILRNGSFESDTNGTTFPNGTVKNNWRFFAVSGATGSATIRSAAASDGSVGMELVLDTFPSGDSALDKDTVRETIPKENRIYRTLADVKDGGVWGGTPKLTYEFQFGTDGYNRSIIMDPSANFETIGMTSWSGTRGDLSVRFSMLDTGATHRSCYIDNVRAEDVTYADRLVNGGFENSSTRFLNWRFNDPNANGSVTISTDARTGGRAALFSRTSAANDMSFDLSNSDSRIAVLGGEALNITFYAKKVSGDSNSRLYCYAEGFDSSGASLGVISSTYANPSSSAYQAFNLSITTQSLAKYISIGFKLYNGSGNQYVGGYLIDDVSAVRPAPIQNYVYVTTNNGQNFSTSSNWVALTGYVQEQPGYPIDRVAVNGSSNTTTYNSSTKVWNYFGPLDTGSNVFDVRAYSGATEFGPALITVTHSSAIGNETMTDFTGGKHLVGTWMFTWFRTRNASSWQDDSPWWPLDGFSTWDGSTAWAKKQLKDMMDANMDTVGLQYDTKSASSYRYTGVINTMSAAAELLREGYRPPRVMMFMDTKIVNDNFKNSSGNTTHRSMDLSTDADRAEFFSYVQTFYDQAFAIYGTRYKNAGLAYYNGKPMLSFWHTDAAAGSVTNADINFVSDLKTRFHTAYGVDPYVIAHPNYMGLWATTDECTLMFGPPTHYYKGGKDGAGKNTINITPGFWNPAVAGTSYLARSGGVNYNSAWTSALAQRSSVDHLYIDSWNETGEGSGLFEASVASYTSSYHGAANDWINTHDESWGTSSRQYIDTTATNAAQWNDTSTNDAAVIANDIPTTMSKNEHRKVTVAVRNTGDRAWTGSQSDCLAITQGSELVPAGSTVAISDSSDEISKYGGIFRNRPHIFTFEIVAPNVDGRYHLKLQMRTSTSTLFGEILNATIDINYIDAQTAADDWMFY